MYRFPVFLRLTVMILGHCLTRTSQAQTVAPQVTSAVAPPAPTCLARTAVVRDSTFTLNGHWDFKMHIGTTVSSGVMSLGWMDKDYAGSLTPDATNTVAIRKLTLRGDSVHMAVATPEGDVLFDGHLSGTGVELCGIVTYHGGRKFSMVATKRSKARAG